MRSGVHARAGVDHNDDGDWPGYPATQCRPIRGGTADTGTRVFRLSVDGLCLSRRAPKATRRPRALHGHPPRCPALRRDLYDAQRRRHHLLAAAGRAFAHVLARTSRGSAGIAVRLWLEGVSVPARIRSMAHQVASRIHARSALVFGDNRRRSGIPGQGSWQCALRGDYRPRRPAKTSLLSRNPRREERAALRTARLRDRAALRGARPFRPRVGHVAPHEPPNPRILRRRNRRPSCSAHEINSREK